MFLVTIATFLELRLDPGLLVSTPPRGKASLNHDHSPDPQKRKLEFREAKGVAQEHTGSSDDVGVTPHWHLSTWSAGERGL